jgi:hypothetical protein
MPDGISIAKNGEVRRLRETDSSDDERSELERSRHRKILRFQTNSQVSKFHVSKASRQLLKRNCEALNLETLQP